MRKGVVAILVTLVGLLSFASTALATDEQPHKVFVCKYVGTPGVDERLQTGDNPISVDTSSLEGKGFNGTFPFEFQDEQGRSVAIEYDTGQPEPSVENCPPPDGPPPTDVCPNIEGNQETIPEGMIKDAQGNCVTPPPPPKQVTAAATFSEATCTSPPAFNFARTIPGLRFYTVVGLIVDGRPVAGETYTITASPDEGYTVIGQSVFTHTFAAAPTNCNPPPPHVVTGAASVFCDSGANLYRVTGTIDGQAGTASPATIPGPTRGHDQRHDHARRHLVPHLGHDER